MLKLKGKGVLVIGSVLLAIIFYINFVLAATYYPLNGTGIFVCGIINQSGTYNLTTSISNPNGTCLRVQANNVLIDLNGYSITGSGSPGNGISISNYNNITVQNGTISGFNNGISIFESSNNLFKEIIINSNTNDIALTTSNMGYQAINNIFLNSSFDPNKVSFNNNSAGGDIELIKKWYADIYVYNSTGVLPNASVNIYNSSNNLENFSLTDLLGNTKLQLIEYILSGGISPIKIFHTPHTINISKSGYFSNTTLVDLTAQHNIISYITLIENIPPLITIISPMNITPYTSSSIDFNISSNENLSLCKFTINNWKTNYTMILNSSLSGADYTNNSIADGNYIAKFWCEDLAGNINNTEKIYFNVDTSSPNITIISPMNTTYSSNIFQLNYVYYDLNPGVCWYLTDNGFTNSTTITAGTNFSGITSIEGNNNWTVYCNDALLNENNFSVTFFKDTIFPAISIDYPLNPKYSINVSELNYTYSDLNPGYCWYSTDNGFINSTPQICGTTNNFTNVISSEGSNTWIIYSNDSAGNLKSSSITFSKDTINPIINIVYPSNGSLINLINANISYTFSEPNIDSCWWTNDLGATNNIINCGENITGQTWNEGINNLTIYMNDSFGNENSKNLSFSVDSITPGLTILAPVNHYYDSSFIQFSISPDENLSYCKFSVDDWANVTSMKFDGINTYYSTSNLNDGNYIVEFECEDLAGNINDSEKISFTINTPDSSPHISTSPSESSNGGGPPSSIITQFSTPSVQAQNIKNNKEKEEKPEEIVLENKAPITKITSNEPSFLDGFIEKLKGQKKEIKLFMEIAAIAFFVFVPITLIWLVFGRK